MKTRDPFHTSTHDVDEWVVAGAGISAVTARRAGLGKMGAAVPPHEWHRNAMLYSGQDRATRVRKALRANRRTWGLVCT